MTNEDLIAAVSELQRKVDELESVNEIERLQQQYPQLGRGGQRLRR
jgi:hypothetical protein